LSQSLNRERDKNRDPATRAICFLISEISERVRFLRPNDWHKNPFLFAAFRIAIAKLLQGTQPAGEVRPPPVNDWVRELKARFGSEYENLAKPLAREIAETWSSPEAAAHAIVGQTVVDIFAGPHVTEGKWQAWMVGVDPKRLSDLAVQNAAALEQTAYGMPDVRRDLGLGAKHRKTSPSKQPKDKGR
jgi:hypothetical protein